MRGPISPSSPGLDTISSREGTHRPGSPRRSGCGALFLGQAILAAQSRRDGGPLTFDALKHRINAGRSPIRRWLVWITMRDFCALAACVMILLGGASILMHIFAIVACCWFALVIRMAAAEAGVPHRR